MSSHLTLLVVIFALLLLIIINYLLYKNKIEIKYALIWILSSLFIILITIIPNLMESIKKLLGFELLSNMIICIFIAVLMFITLILTVLLNKQKRKTTLLIQELSIIKSELEERK